MPLYILAIVPFLLLGYGLNIELSLGYVLLGALGWWVALLLRMPFILIINKLTSDMLVRNKYIVGLSGPTEEGVRLVLLLLIGLNFEHAFLIGVGWAAVEIVYALVQAFALAALKRRTDAKALEAKAMLEKLGMDKTLDDSAALWGALERVSASGLHLAFSLLLVVSPWLVIVTVMIHSAVNYAVVAVNKRSLAGAQALLLGLAAILLSVALIFAR